MAKVKIPAMMIMVTPAVATGTTGKLPDGVSSAGVDDSSLLESVLVPSELEASVLADSCEEAASLEECCCALSSLLAPATASSGF